MLYYLTALFTCIFRRVASTEKGASLVEYALILALIVVVAIGALIAIGNVTNNSLNNSGNAFTP